MSRPLKPIEYPLPSAVPSAVLLSGSYLSPRFERYKAIKILVEIIILGWVRLRVSHEKVCRFSREVSFNRNNPCY